MSACCGSILEALASICGSSPPKREPQSQRVSRPRTPQAVGTFVVDHKGSPKDLYDFQGKEIGSGSYGSVRQARHNTSKAIRAIKTVSKIQAAAKPQELEKLHIEIGIMKQLDHPGIIKLFETFEDQKNIYLVMELCTGGELFDRIVEVGHFTEGQAAIIMQQMISAIYYMHTKEICHRDLKPENFLFSSKEPIEKACLKLIDFGLSAAFRKKKFTTRAGTPYYVAPQVLQGSYDQACDLWSCGVIMYVLLCGEPPFYGESDKLILEKVRKGTFSFDPEAWGTVSEDAKELISKLLTMRPHHRYTAEQALHHVWITEKAPRASEMPLRSGLVDSLRKFRGANKLKQAALGIIANQLTGDNIKGLRDMFIALDSNGDGMLSASEMRDGLERSGVKNIPPDLLQIVRDIDSDHSGQIDYTEFLAATLDERHYLEEEVAWQAFCVFDRNGDGRITQDEVKEVLRAKELEGILPAEELARMMAEVDQDGNGEIDFQEFMAMLQK